MAHYEKLVINKIKESYNDFTTVERGIADFFISNTERLDFSSKNMSSLLYVSEASLSRFAKKCGYKGFREFIFDYEKTFDNQSSRINEMTRRVFTLYQDLLDKSLKLINEEQMGRVAKLLSEAKRVYVYGMGSSGIAAQEFKIRFMRLGLWAEAINDAHMIKMNSALVYEDCLVIAFSVSGETEEILTGIEIAKKKGAKVIIVTSNKSESFSEICDEVVHIAASKSLGLGTMISPQFPILIMVDIFYIYYLNSDFHYKSSKHNETLSALYSESHKKPAGKNK